MRRALRASRLVASVVATFLYLAFEEAMRARAAQAAEGLSVPKPRRASALSVHERPTLPGTVEAPIRDLVRMSPEIRVIEPPSRAVDLRPAVLFAVEEDAATGGHHEETPVEKRPDGRSLDCEQLLETLRRDVGCRGGDELTHDACRAAEALGGFVDRDAVVAALEETITAAGRPHCVGEAGVGSLGRSSRKAARAALTRMLSVARGRASFRGTRSDREMVAVLLRALDAKG